MEEQAKQRAIEALLFATGEAMDVPSLAQWLDATEEETKQSLNALAQTMARDEARGLWLREADGRWQLATKPSEARYLQKLYGTQAGPDLSPAAYETLAVIAYNQPVTRAQVESVRGVNSDGMIARLVERNLVRSMGQLDAPGRPTLFGTTEDFLHVYGLRSLTDLPPMDLLMYESVHALEQGGTAKDGFFAADQLSIEGLMHAPSSSMPPQSEREEAGA